MFFAPKRQLRSMNDILVDKCKINDVEETKFWGFVIDNTLKWSSYLKYISGEIGVTVKARKVFSPARKASNKFEMICINYCMEQLAAKCTNYTSPHIWNFILP